VGRSVSEDVPMKHPDELLSLPCFFLLISVIKALSIFKLVKPGPQGMCTSLIHSISHVIHFISTVWLTIEHNRKVAKNHRVHPNRKRSAHQMQSNHTPRESRH
jgi:hypothetical protein